METLMMARGWRRQISKQQFLYTHSWLEKETEKFLSFLDTSLKDIVIYCNY